MAFPRKNRYFPGRSSAQLINSYARRDLPKPACPHTVTTWVSLSSFLLEAPFLSVQESKLFYTHLDGYVYSNAPGVGHELTDRLNALSIPGNRDKFKIAFESEPSAPHSWGVPMVVQVQLPNDPANPGQ